MLSDLIEASDLSPHPGAVLAAAAARSPGAGRRDVVILTHPRSLIEPEVMAAGRLVASEAGQRHSAFCGPGRFARSARAGRAAAGIAGRAGAQPDRARAGDGGAGEPHAAAAGDRWPPWKGDFEPIGFPFSCGLLDVLERSADWQNLASQSFDFDESGERILAIGLDRLLFTCRLDGTGVEHLPMPVHDGQPVIAGAEGDRGRGRLRVTGSQPRRVLSGSLRFSVAHVRGALAGQRDAVGHVVIFSRPACDRAGTKD